MNTTDKRSMPTWLRIVAVFEIGFALVGLATSPSTVAFSATNARVMWPMDAIAFFGFSMLAGALVLRRRRGGIVSSFIVQVLQAVMVNGGWRYIFTVGPQITAVYASHGLAAIFGAGGLYFLRPDPPDGTFGAIGLGGSMALSFMDPPLQNQPWAIGVNLVAVYFAAKLWILICADPVATNPEMASVIVAE